MREVRDQGGSRGSGVGVDADTGECCLEEVRRTGGTQHRECLVLHSKVLSPGKKVRVSADSGNQFTHDDAKAEDVSSLVIELASQTLRTHPVR